MGCSLDNNNIKIQPIYKCTNLILFSSSKSIEIKTLSELKPAPSDFISEGTGKITQEYVFSKKTLAVGIQIIIMS